MLARRSHLNQPEPRLAPPGAPLPFLDRVLLKYYVGPFMAKRAQVEQSRARFEKLHAKILEIARSIPPEMLTHKVLVKPQRGLEDSSRYWSAAMVLEHMLIVGEGCCHIIRELSAGRDPNVRPRTERLKPKGAGAGLELIEQFAKFTMTCMPEMDPLVRERDSSAAEVHPWFGPMRARAWFWLLGVHAGIHYQQLKQIKKALANV